MREGRDAEKNVRIGVQRGLMGGIEQATVVNVFTIWFGISIENQGSGFASFLSQMRRSSQNWWLPVRTARLCDTLLGFLSR